MLSAYFDDSGTHSPSPVVALGGLLGTDQQWAKFNIEWRKLLEHPLERKPTLSQFHLTPCQHRRREFRDYSPLEKDHVTSLFNQVILDVGLVTIAVAVNKVAWNELVVGDIAAELGHAEGLCFVKCLEAVISTIRFRKPGQRVTLIFDQGITDRIEDMAKLYHSQKAIYPELYGIGFGKVAEILPLQGADIIATGSYQYAQEWLKNRGSAVAKKYFEPYIKRELSYGCVIDREQIEEMVRRVREILTPA